MKSNSKTVDNIFSNMAVSNIISCNLTTIPDHLPQSLVISNIFSILIESPTTSMIEIGEDLI